MGVSTHFPPRCECRQSPGQGKTAVTVEALWSGNWDGTLGVRPRALTQRHPSDMKLIYWDKQHGYAAADRGGDSNRESQRDDDRWLKYMVGLFILTALLVLGVLVGALFVLSSTFVPPPFTRIASARRGAQETATSSPRGHSRSTL